MSTVAQPTVRVYSSGPNCMACRQTKRHMDKRGISYTEEVADEFVTASALFLGLRQAPIVCAETAQGDYTFWDGYRPDRIDALAVAP